MYKTASLKQITELDRLAMEEAGLDILQMMEMAGNSFALKVKKYFKDLKGKNILVLSGTGHNGGDGLSAARYLNNWGANVRIVLAKEDLKDATSHHLKILEKMPLTIEVAPTKLHECDLIIDSLLGYNQKGDPRLPYDKLITMANSANSPIFSFDNPSGINIETGKVSKPTIKAASTVTLAVVKKGLVEENTKQYIGNLLLVDLGIPKWVYTKLNLEYPFINGESN